MMDTFLFLTFLLILGVVLWALLGKGEGRDKRKDTIEESPDKLYRRRAFDKDIEEEFPDDKRNQLKRKTDVQPEAISGEPGDDFTLPFLVDDIISERSRFKVYKRTLVNSEIYAKKGDFNTAISLYQGVNKRINDKNVTSKINTDIEYLKNYQKNSFEKKKEIAQKQKSEGKGSEIKFTIDGPLKIPEKIQIDLATFLKGKAEPKVDLEKMTDDIIGRLTDKNLIPSDSKKMIEDYEAQIGGLKDKVNRLVKEKTGAGAIEGEASAEGIEGSAVNESIKNDIKSLESKYKDEFAKIKGAIEGIVEEKAVDAGTQKIIDKYQSDVERLQSGVSQLMDFKEKAEKDKSPDSRPVDEASMGTIKEVIKNLNNRIEQLSDKERKTMEDIQEVKTYNRVFAEGLLKGKGVPDESEKAPALAEAKFQAAGTQKGISKELSTPSKEAPGPKPVTMPGKKGIAEEKEKPDFELLSEYGREEEDEFPDESDELSDADIFNKILSSDTKKKDEDSFEILGYKKEENEIGFEIEDAELEKKRVEEEKFYRKFLKHDKRKKKELPILKVSYDFTKLPDDFSLSRDKNILEYSFYKYKGLLEKANELIKTRNVKDAINYYKVVMSQNIPFEFKSMLRKNINELTEYIEKYLSTD